MNHQRRLFLLVTILFQCWPVFQCHPLLCFNNCRLLDRKEITRNTGGKKGEIRYLPARKNSIWVIPRLESCHICNNLREKRQMQPNSLKMKSFCIGKNLWKYGSWIHAFLCKQFFFRLSVSIAYSWIELNSCLGVV